MQVLLEETLMVIVQSYGMGTPNGSVLVHLGTFIPHFQVLLKRQI